MATILLGTLIGLLGLAGIVTPPRLLQIVNAFWGRSSGFYLAIVIRLVFGVILLSVAPLSRFPLAIQVIGLLAIAGALLLPFIGRHRIERLVNWCTSQPEIRIRLWAVVVVLFGLFLIYACL